MILQSPSYIAYKQKPSGCALEQDISADGTNSVEESMEELNGAGRMHKVILTNRRTCILNGVNDVLSFDIHEILLETEQGMLMIKGDDLHVNRLTLDKGEVDIDGRIDSFTYSDAGPGGSQKESLLARLFR